MSGRRKWRGLTKTLLAAVMLVMAGSSPAAPAPLPKPKNRTSTSGTWEVDFSPLSTAGKVSVIVTITVKRKDDSTIYQCALRWDGKEAAVRRVVVRYGRSSAGVRLGPSAGAFTEDLVNCMNVGADKVWSRVIVDPVPGTTRLSVRPYRGIPILSVTATMKGGDKKFTPIVLIPGKK
jgi:hypothetical protein